MKVPGRPAPFLKWAGGKRRLAPKIASHLPRRIRTYYEPFVGGGALFFHLAATRRFDRAVLGDINGELVEVYGVVRDQVDDLITALHAHAVHAEEADYFYPLRAQSPDSLATPVARAARFIFLNKTCFNGLYRVNKRGQFNVPFGHYKKPLVVDEVGLKAASQALKDVTLCVGDFAHTVHAAGRGDAVYFDPPYVPSSKTASFTAYHGSDFGRVDHTRLRDLFARCTTIGVATVSL